jgi:MscS family membrane protein
MIKIALRQALWVLTLALMLPASQLSAQSSDLGAILDAIEDPYPLRSADTSSPRDTFRTYLRDITTAVEAWEDDQPSAEIDRLLLRAADTFDFSEISDVDRSTTIVIKMFLLKEILDRVALPPFGDIPDDEQVAQDGIVRWTVPNTKIEIAKVAEGPDAGEFLFTKETVANLDDYYALAKDLPYKAGANVGLYNEYISTPGPWISRDFPDELPGWAQLVVLGQGIWQWIAGILLLGISGTVIWFVYRLGAQWDERHRLARPTVRFGVPLALLLAVLVADFVKSVSIHAIGLYEVALATVSYIALAVQVGGLAWLALVVASRLADGVAFSQEGPTEKRRFDAALLRIVFRLISIVILVYLAIYAAGAVGIPIAPLVAGLGVGGLAIALAIRPTLENIIGGLTLFADRPVRVGDFCRYGDQIGTVEQIGLRSTRVRSLERTIVTIPNAEFSQMQLDNFAARDQRLLKTVLGLRYETTPDQLRHVLAELRQMLVDHPKVTKAPARVRFVGYGAYSLDIEIFAYLYCRDQDSFLEIQEELLLRIADIVTGCGTAFAFPSQTTYFTRDKGLDSDVAPDLGVVAEHGRVA